MKIKAIVHEAEEGGFWAEVPAIPGCVSQGETMDELIANLHEAIEGCLAIDIVESRPEAARCGNCGVRQWGGREFARLLERHDWRLLRINGSHHIYSKP